MDKFTRTIIDKNQQIALIEGEFTFLSGDLLAVESQPAFSKFVRWTEQYAAGDCFIYPGANMTIHDSGTLDWESAVQSSDSHDTWHIRFDFFDANKVHLFTAPSQNNGEAWYFHPIAVPHQAREFKKTWEYNSDFFERIASVKFDYKC